MRLPVEKAPREAFAYATFRRLLSHYSSCSQRAELPRKYSIMVFKNFRHIFALLLWCPRFDWPSWPVCVDLLNSVNSRIAIVTHLQPELLGQVAAVRFFVGRDPFSQVSESAALNHRKERLESRAGKP